MYFQNGDIMKRTHEAGDFVTYRQNGICKINKRVRQSFGGMGEREYFELSPVYDAKTVIFVPVDSYELTGEMCHILNADEINDIISRSEEGEGEWISDTKQRAEAFGEILRGNDRAKILWIIKVLSLYKRELEENKKKLYASDAKLLAAAQKAITEEFAFVLGIQREEVIPYIINKIGK